MRKLFGEQAALNLPGRVSLLNRAKRRTFYQNVASLMFSRQKITKNGTQCAAAFLFTGIIIVGPFSADVKPTLYHLPFSSTT